jgi:antitoxin CptB
MTRLQAPSPIGTQPALQKVEDAALIDERALSKLKWRCRRGLLENDLFIERFFKRFDSRLTISNARGMSELMELADNDLLDVLLSRKSIADVDAALDTVYVNEVLKMLKGN